MQMQARIQFVRLFILLFAVLCGCNPNHATPKSGAVSVLLPPVSQPLFEDVTEKAGIHFILANGAKLDRPLFPEATPAGCAFFDYDNDGFIDIFLVNSGELSPGNNYLRPYCALYHNNRNGTFTDVTKDSGFDVDLGYCHGVAVGDYDNDGYEDIFITGMTGNHLFHNVKGTGKFLDVTAKMGLSQIKSTGYATSAAFGDYDNDGRLDLYVCYYCPWTLAKDKPCKDREGSKEYCSPEVYPMDYHVLYHNEGSRFTDVSEASGIRKVKGRGLAVTFLDYDEDGKQDIFVANDFSGNMLWHNEGGGKFVEKGAEVGVRYGSGGSLMAGMGISVSDYDQSGHESLLVSNFENMQNMLFKNGGKGAFEDVSVMSKVGPLHLPFLTFGCEFIDYDADGYPDILTANGHVQFQGKGFEGMKQSKQLLHNDRAGVFSEIVDSGKLCELKKPTISRGIAVGDFDNDGRLDALFTNQNDRPQLFKNRDNSANHWISFKTVGTKSNRDGIHTKFILTAGGRRRIATVRSGSSYLSVSDRRVYFGLGSTEKIERIEVQWPSGIRDELTDLKVDHSYIVIEGKGARKLSKRQLAGSRYASDRTFARKPE